MQRTLVLFFAAVALALCASKTYTITLYSPAVVGSTELKPGEYRVQLVDQNAVIVNGKSDTRTPVKVETVAEKFGQTSVRIANSDGKARVQEIRLGGTNTKLVLAEPSANSGN